ncbi:MAG: F0F1 ATP synthase subunit B [Geminocystis sp.]|nr:F0F1 ATP synthase subunit B [Geminocystis sp.]HIK37612.1 F0F1 ATP synthase subunit B [Geminocystis sp. M7585_C2015_104]MCS7146584.1 F0F1 ATP synthase subunit B [Geminocystis sp.]MCX8077517.1 F0F1 ATP synthase subunit B [Geminocystis sp.]MDW8115410.1 F0F1 ATP synthase subunit B [Geminocystis sp.]
MKIGLLYLAMEQEAARGFGINPDILGSNVINLVIMIALLVVYGGKVLNNILAERRERIAQEIREAEERAAAAAAELQQAKKNLEQAHAKAEQIKAEALQRAEQLRTEILAQGEKEIEKMRLTAAQELESERKKVISTLKRQIALRALERAEQQLKERLNDELQAKLITRALEQLGG